MRTVFLAPVLASLVIATVRPADACGPYVREPKLMRLSGHYTRDVGARSIRSFVLLEQAVPNAEKLAWKQLAPGTYDYAAVVDTADLDRAMDVTLIGPAGTRVVSSKERVFLARTFVSNTPTVALEITVPKGEFAIAMAGKHADATWIQLDRERQGNASDLSWVKGQGLEPLAADLIYVSKLAGTDFETVTVLPKGGGMKTLVRSNGTLYTSFEGSAIGALTSGGQMFLVASKHGEAPTAIWI